MTLVLASASPRRRELLSRLGFEFTVVPAAVDERIPHAGEGPEHYAGELARYKAHAVYAAKPTVVVLAADTVVAIDRCLLGKPADKAEARLMLKKLRDRVHVVTTGVTALYHGLEFSGSVSTSVYMRNFTDEEIEHYVATGEPNDKAGAYAVQGIGRRLVECVDGCLEAVIGLPLCLTTRLLNMCCPTVPATDAYCRHLSAGTRLPLG